VKILCLYNNKCAEELFEWLEEQGHVVVLCKERVQEEWCKKQLFDLAISYTYRYLISPRVLDVLEKNVVNIHNSLLPWNRGADPNLWSIIDNTPRGVTLHYINAEVDKGEIIAQEMVDVSSNESLIDSYMKLDSVAKEMFKKAFKYYNYWPSLKKKCTGEGSYHSITDGIEKWGVIEKYDISEYEFKKDISGEK